MLSHLFQLLSPSKSSCKLKLDHSFVNDINGTVLDNESLDTCSDLLHRWFWPRVLCCRRRNTTGGSGSTIMLIFCCSRFFFFFFYQIGRVQISINSAEILSSMGLRMTVLLWWSITLVTTEPLQQLLDELQWNWVQIPMGWILMTFVISHLPHCEHINSLYLFIKHYHQIKTTVRPLLQFMTKPSKLDILALAVLCVSP